jgi:hypothetical protein
MSDLSHKLVEEHDLHLVWDSLLFLIGEADVFHASVLERLHIIETTLKGGSGDAVLLGNAINRRAETSGLAKGLLLLNQVITNLEKRYLLSELQDAQNGILKRLQDLRKTFSVHEEKITAPDQSECIELVNLTGSVREAIDDHYDILRSAVYTLVTDPIGGELTPENSREIKQYYEELLNIREKHNFRHEATSLLYEDWINYIDKNIEQSDLDEIKEIDLEEMGQRYSKSSEHNYNDSNVGDPDDDRQFEQHIEDAKGYSNGLELDVEDKVMTDVSESIDEDVKLANSAETYLSEAHKILPGPDQNMEIREAVDALSGKVGMLDKDLSKTLNEINMRLDMITFGAKEKKITTVYRNESEVLEKLGTTEKRLEDRQKKVEKKLEEYNAGLEFKLKRISRQFDKQISDVIKSEVEISDKIHMFEDQLKNSLPDSDELRALKTSDRRLLLVENQLNQLEKNFTIFKNLLEAKYNQRLEQTEQKYLKLRESLYEDINHLKEQVVETVKRTESRNFEIENAISDKLDEIRTLMFEKK